MIRAPLSPACALIAHIEPLIVERRVVVIGNAEGSLGEHLVARGARLVQILDPEPKRVSTAAANNGERRVSYAQYSETTLREGSFDCVLVEDVNLVSDFGRLVENVRRSMNSRAIAIFCATNPHSTDGLLGVKPGRIDYDTLCETTEAHFEAVITLGQSPFLGYSVVRFDLDNPPEPALDNAYLGGKADPPDLYVALCGSEEALADLSLEEMSIVQLPAARFVENSERIHREREQRAARRVQNLEKELKDLQGRGASKEVERLTKQLDERDTWIKQLESRAESADARADDAEGEVEDLEREIEESHRSLVAERKAHEATRATSARESETLKKELLALRVELTNVRKEAAENAHQSAGREALEVEVTKLDAKNKELEARLADKSRALERMEKRLSEQERELDDLHDQLDETENALAKAKATPPVSVPDEAVTRDLASLETQLQSRGKHIADLEEQLRKLELYAKTLSVELQVKNSNGEAAEGGDPAEVKRLSRALAEREADLVAAQWTIGQLRQTSLKE